MNRLPAILIFATCLILTGLVATTLPADETMPGKRPSGPVALTGVTLHTMTGETIENGTLLMIDGKIAAVGDAVEIPAEAESIDLSGMHVYPGMFESHSQLGITEISSIRPTWDFEETGDVNPNVQANKAVNPDNIVLPVTRANGVLLGLSAPTGGLIAGRSSVLQLDGWTFEEMTLLPAAALQVDWPSTTISPRLAAFLSPEELKERQKAQGERLKEIREYFDKARRYRDARRNPELDQAFDAKLEAMVDVVEGKVPLMIRADQVAEIESAVAFCVEQDVKMILLGGYDAEQCASLLKAHDIPVIVSAVYRLPSRRHEPYDAAYTLPNRLLEAGIRFCISGTDRSETWNARTLPYHAGTAVAYGLPEEEAMRAITRYPAEILGVGDRVGTLEVGKDATLIVATGSPLEATSDVVHAWVQGRKLDLSSRHTRLYEKYKEKYARQKEE